MLRELRKRFKFVVIDSPPVLPVTDAMILSTLVDGVVFVVESGATVRGAVTRARAEGEIRARIEAEIGQSVGLMLTAQTSPGLQAAMAHAYQKVLLVELNERTTP